MVKVVWTDLAIKDLTSIHENISKDSKFYADRFVKKHINRADQLENHPQPKRIAPKFGKEAIRELIEGNYRIIFQIKVNYAGVVRVHNWAQLLKDM